MPLHFLICFIGIVAPSLLLIPAAARAQDAAAPPSPPAAPAAAHEVDIVVSARGTGVKLERVEVKLGTEILYTDPKGQVHLAIPAGDGDVLLELHGYQKLFIPYADLRKDPEYRAFLLPGEPDDNVIVIRGNRRPEVSRKTISVEETRRIAPGGDPAQIAKLMPGVQSNGFSPEVIIRGSGPMDSKYYIDQLMVPQIFHRIGNISVLPDQLVSDVQFSSGGFSPQYGEATGGVIVLRTTSEIPDRPKTSFLVNVPNYSGIYHERPLSEDSALAVSTRVSYLQYIIPAIIPKELDTTAVPYFGDAHLRYLKKFDDGYDKYLTLFSRDGLAVAAPFSETSSEDGKLKFDFVDTFVATGVERYRTLGNGWTLRTTPQVNYSTQSVDVADTYFYGKFANLLAPIEVGKRIDKNRSFFAGLDLDIFNYSVDLKAPQFVRDDPFFDAEEAPIITLNQKGNGFMGGAWAQIDTEAGPVILTPGLRVFYNSIMKDVGYDPRLSGRYELTDDTTLKASIGQYSISPEPQELAKDYGNPDLAYEASHHFITGIEKNFGDRWTTEVQVFHKRTFKLIFSDPKVRYKGEGTRLTDGFELFIRRNMTERMFGWLAYTYSKSQERKDDASDYGISPYDQTHNLNLAGSYKLDVKWDLGMRFKYNTGSPYTPVAGSKYNANLDKYQPVSLPGALNSKRIPDYHSADIFATTTSFYETWKLSHRFGLSMLAVEPQVYGVTYNYDYSKTRYFKGIPPIPFYEVRGEF